MEKRFALFLLLSSLVLFGWMIVDPPAVQGERGEASDPATQVEEGLEEAREPGLEERVAEGLAGAGEPSAAAGSPPPAVAAEPPPDEPGAGEAPAGAPATDDLPRWQEWLEIGRGGGPGHYWARFDNLGGALVELRIDGFWQQPDLAPSERGELANRTPLLVPVDTGQGRTSSMLLGTRPSSQALAPLPLENELWTHRLVSAEDGTLLGVEFAHTTQTGVTFRKRITSDPGHYRLRVSIGIENDNPELARGQKQFRFGPAACVPPQGQDAYYVEPSAVAAWAARSGDEPVFAKKEREPRGRQRSGSLGGGDELLYAGAQNKYFAVLMRATGDSRGTLMGPEWNLVRDQDFVRENPGSADEAYRYVAADVDLLLFVPGAGEGETRWEYEVYAGPKQRAILEAEGGEAFLLLANDDLGWFQTIARGLVAVLDLFHSITGNWGWAIILLTLSVRLVLFPVNRRSQTAMARHQTKMKRVQPRLEAAKERYKSDPQKYRQEQARIMQEEGAFPPLGGCLPIFVQIPIFIGLFQALRTSFDLRHAPFHGWIRDLSQPDHLLRIDLGLPLVGTIEYLNVLPILMVVLWVLQQRLMPMPADPQAQRMQRMMMFMPVVMGVFLYNYAAGLSLYMITQSGLGIVEQGVIKKLWPVDATEKPRKPSGFMARLAELQRQAQEAQRAQKRRPGGGGGKPRKK